MQTRRCDVYGQDAGYDERVMLIYDGLHYDALAVAGERALPEHMKYPREEDCLILCRAMAPAHLASLLRLHLWHMRLQGSCGAAAGRPSMCMVCCGRDGVGFHWT